MTMSLRSLVILACLAVAGPALAQSPPTPPPTPPPMEPPPMLDPNTPPVLDPSAPPAQAVGMPLQSGPVRNLDNAAQLEFDSARLQCRTLPEQQRQACMDAAQRAFDQRLRRDDPVR